MDQVVCLSENSKITVHSPLLITWLIWTFQQVHVLCRLILLSSQPSQSFNLVKGCICWYSSLFSSVSSVCIQISGTWKRGTFLSPGGRGDFFFSHYTCVWAMMPEAPYIHTTLETFCTEAGSQDSLYLTITLAGWVVMGGEVSMFLWAFCVCGWLWGFCENDMESEFMVIQSRQQNELVFVFLVCDKILFNCKILSQVSCFF